MTPEQCTNCRHFQPEPDNPSAAMGRCLSTARHGYFFALELHRCVDHEAKEVSGDASTPS